MAPRPKTDPPREAGPENLADVLGRLFATRGWGRKGERSQLEGAWAEAATAAFAPLTRVAGLKRGVLEVEVRNAVAMQELAHFHKRRLLAELRAKLPNAKIGDLRFRAAAW